MATNCRLKTLSAYKNDAKKTCLARFFLIRYIAIPLYETIPLEHTRAPLQSLITPKPFCTPHASSRSMCSCICTSAPCTCTSATSAQTHRHCAHAHQHRAQARQHRGHTHQHYAHTHQQRAHTHQGHMHSNMVHLRHTSVPLLERIVGKTRVCLHS